MKKVGSDKLITIEELERLENTNHAVHVAVCRGMDWYPGKSITAAEYRAAVKGFLGSPMGRRVK